MKTFLLKIWKERTKKRFEKFSQSRDFYTRILKTYFTDEIKDEIEADGKYITLSGTRFICASDDFIEFVRLYSSKVSLALFISLCNLYEKYVKVSDEKEGGKVIPLMAMMKLCSKTEAM